MKTRFKQGIRSLMVGMVFGTAISFYNFSLVESNIDKKRILIRNLKFIYQQRSNQDTGGCPLKVLNPEEESLVKSSLANNELIIIPFFYYTYKDYFLSSISSFFLWLGNSKNRSSEFVDFIKNKFI